MHSYQLTKKLHIGELETTPPSLYSSDAKSIMMIIKIIIIQKRLRRRRIFHSAIRTEKTDIL